MQVCKYKLIDFLSETVAITYREKDEIDMFIDEAVILQRWLNAIKSNDLQECNSLPFSCCVNLFKKLLLLIIFSFNYHQNYLRQPRYMFSALSHDISRSIGNNGN